jgi:hypothetical protein
MDAEVFHVLKTLAGTRLAIGMKAPNPHPFTQATDVHSSLVRNLLMM